MFYRTLVRSLFAFTMLVSATAIPAIAGVYVVDGDTFDLDGTRIRINGIDAPEFGQKCGSWECGKAAAAKLADLLRSGAVRCKVHGADGYGRSIATCTSGNRDIGAEMVATGYAWAFVKYSDAYEDQQDLARKAGLGIWSEPSQPAWEYRAAAWDRAEQQSPRGCPIKGNISENGRIYHAPWSPWYSRTRINEAKGERWFCSEAEAVAAGWRAPEWAR
jgi:endonuclease YncB( thermonuclease family)